jgi:hypothetical protein
MEQEKRFICVYLCSSVEKIYRNLFGADLEKIVLSSFDDGLRPAADVKFAVNLVQMPFGGALGDIELIGDLTVRETVSDQPQDFELSFGESFNRRPFRRLPGRRQRCCGSRSVF